MTDRAIKTPKAPATFFLIFGLLYFLSAISGILTHIELFTKQEETPIPEIIWLLLLGLTNLIMSSVLFLKYYNKKLILASGLLLIPDIFLLFADERTYLIGDIFFYLLLTIFIYIMIKMPETTIREEITKFRFIIPLFQFILLLLSTIDVIVNLYEKLMATMGPDLSSGISTAIVLIPSIISATYGFLPVFCYIFLVDWLADPYKK